MRSLQVNPHRSSLGLDANFIMLIAYFGSGLIARVRGLSSIAWLLPLVVFLLERRSRFVRFHAMQAFVLSLVGVAYGLAVSLLFGRAINAPWTAPPQLLGPLATLGSALSLVVLVAAIVAAINGLQWIEYRLPVVGAIADRLAASVGGFTHRDGG
jgi:uncharacterized membrane protein